MPSRPVVFLIVLFWLGSMAWLTVREVVPWLEAGESPHFAIDLTDEVDANTITWTVMLRGEAVGTGISQVRRHPDRTYELKSEFKFDQFKVGDVVELKKMMSRYRINLQGELLELNAKVQLKAQLLGFLEGELIGKVEEDSLHLKVVIDGMENLIQVPPLALGEQRKVLNPMHLINRLSNLRVGQRWRIPLLDPAAFGLQGQTIPWLEAEVHADDLAWQEVAIPCFRIDYREPGNDVTARTWVRRYDGLVLQQDARHQKVEFSLVRNPSR